MHYFFCVTGTSMVSLRHLTPWKAPSSGARTSSLGHRACLGMQGILVQYKAPPPPLQLYAASTHVLNAKCSRRSPMLFFSKPNCFLMSLWSIHAKLSRDFGVTRVYWDHRTQSILNFIPAQTFHKDLI